MSTSRAKGLTSDLFQMNVLASFFKVLKDLWSSASLFRVAPGRTECSEGLFVQESRELERYRTISTDMPVCQYSDSSER